MTKLVGIHYLLAFTPFWITAAVLLLTTEGAIYLLRDNLEGLGYQTSYSAKFGDLGIFVAVLIAVEMLQKPDVIVPAWLDYGWIQLILLGICVALGLYVGFRTWGMRSAQVADIYHDAVIAPFILFCAPMLLPIFWYNANLLQWKGLIIAVIVWAGLVVFDFSTGRINQRQWLFNHGIVLRGSIPKW